MRHARQFIVTGRVQGVGFRFFARDAAGREGLHGWVRNLGDGSLEINAEGEAAALERFEHTIRRGPPSAHVEEVEVSDLGPTGRESGFDISNRGQHRHMEDLKSKIRHVPDFPKAGILFYDITTLLQDGAGFRSAVDSLATPFMNQHIDVVVGIESRGFIFGAPVADRLGAGFAPVRKPGKLPSRTRSASYNLEYGTDSLQIHDDAVCPGQRVLIVDDLLATGGTAKAACDLVTGLGGQVHAVAFLIELLGLNGRDRLTGFHLHSVLQY